ncbi:MAG TPA: universal stress protein [Dehalococcoidia bacterium]|nr:universal stress protein [Dehalococcoidia bacterium]
MIQRILAPIDGSEQTEAILPYLEELARRLSSSIVLLLVYPPCFAVTKEPPFPVR